MTSKSPKQDIQGLLLLDKPIGMSSNRALQMIKRTLNAKKAGHGGSLDPLATGMLPIAFGRTTKLLQYLLNSDKSYRATVKLGEVTTTLDAEGEVIETAPVPNISINELTSQLQHFMGPIEQVPPMYSALKHKGQPLYKLARAGKTIERPPRKVTIHALEVEHFDGVSFTMNVTCSKGTYIRTLAHDIGQAIGCGAHITALRRTACAPYAEDQMLQVASIDDVSCDQLQGSLLSPEAACQHCEAITVDARVWRQLGYGQAVDISGLTCGQLYRLYVDTSFQGIVTLGENHKVKVIC